MLPIMPNIDGQKERLTGCAPNPAEPRLGRFRCWGSDAPTDAAWQARRQAVIQRSPKPTGSIVLSLTPLPMRCFYWKSGRLLTISAVATLAPTTWPTKRTM